MITLEKRPNTDDREQSSSRFARVLGRAANYVVGISHPGKHNRRNVSPAPEIIERITTENRTADQVSAYGKRWGADQLPLFTHPDTGPPPPVGLSATPTEVIIPEDSTDQHHDTTQTSSKPEASFQNEETKQPFTFDVATTSKAMQDPEFAELVQATRDLTPKEMVETYQATHGKYTVDASGKRENFPLFTHGVEIVEPAVIKPLAPNPHLRGQRALSSTQSKK